MLTRRPLSYKKSQLTQTIDTKGWTNLDSKSEKLQKINLKKVLRRKPTGLSVEFIGYSNNNKLATLFGIYLKHKKLPLFELSTDLYKRKVILRYQGRKSFQRATVMLGRALGNWSVLSAEVNKTHFTVTVGCNEVKSFKLHQKMARIPRRAFGVLGSDRYGENKFTVSQSKYELQHEISNNVVCATSKASDQPAHAQSDQSLCLPLEYSLNVKLLTEHDLEFLSLKGGCTGSSESTLVKMPHCWK